MRGVAGAIGLVAELRRNGSAERIHEALDSDNQEKPPL